MYKMSYFVRIQSSSGGTRSSSEDGGWYPTSTVSIKKNTAALLMNVIWSYVQCISTFTGFF